MTFSLNIMRESAKQPHGNVSSQPIHAGLGIGVPRYAGTGIECGAAEPASPGNRRTRHRQGIDLRAPALSIAALGKASANIELCGSGGIAAGGGAVRP